MFKSIEELFRNDDAKVNMILNFITAAIWSFCAFLSYRSLTVYNHGSRFSLYFDAALALFYLGMSLGYAVKYSNRKKRENR